MTTRATTPFTITALNSTLGRLNQTPTRPTVPLVPGSDLRATTEAGAAMVAAAECFAEQFAPGALEHDRDATFATEHLAALRQGRFLVAPIPVDFGGGGVTSIHDVLVATPRLSFNR